MSLETPSMLSFADVTEPEAEPEAPAAPAHREGRGIRPWFGWAMFALAVAALAVDVVVYAVGESQPHLAWTLLWVAVGLSGAAAVGGAVALVVGWGRLGGAIGLVLGVIVNPGVFSAVIHAATALTPY